MPSNVCQMIAQNLEHCLKDRSEELSELQVLFQVEEVTMRFEFWLEDLPNSVQIGNLNNSEAYSSGATLSSHLEKCLDASRDLRELATSGASDLVERRAGAAQALYSLQCSVGNVLDLDDVVESALNPNATKDVSASLLSSDTSTTPEPAIRRGPTKVDSGQVVRTPSVLPSTDTTTAKTRSTKPANSDLRNAVPRHFEGTNIFRRIYNWLPDLYWNITMDITIVGLQATGKTSLLRVLTGGEFAIDSIPTAGFNMKRSQKGRVILKLWDMGGQPRFRPMWEPYCTGVKAIVYMVDSSDKEAIPVAKDELHYLLEKPATEGIPLLVLGNKSDRPGHLNVDEVIEELNLKAVTRREVGCYGISVKEEINLDAVLGWLTSRA